ncbi:hypothetical protein EWB00_008690 [Schistosoma japonicum]|uniref:Uncharacterized protein n=1 Tax=Schistosoma japonicum TaxID=6182 RepID=A0A4Z2CNZ8_SCHJA|nr:hypothetical protein EWB00_008690 [Schistosoma japonicum]
MVKMKECLKSFRYPRKTWKWIFHFISFTLCLILLLYRTLEWLKTYHLLVGEYQDPHYHQHQQEQRFNGLIDYFQYSHLDKLKINHESHSSTFYHYDYHKDHIKTNNNIDEAVMKRNTTIILCNINPISYLVYIGTNTVIFL